MIQFCPFCTCLDLRNNVSNAATFPTACGICLWAWLPCHDIAQLLTPPKTPMLIPSSSHPPYILHSLLSTLWALFLQKLTFPGKTFFLNILFPDMNGLIIGYCHLSNIKITSKSEKKNFIVIMINTSCSVENYAYLKIL